jgi:hypothetical protein
MEIGLFEGDLTRGVSTLNIKELKNKKQLKNILCLTFFLYAFYIGLVKDEVFNVVGEVEIEVEYTCEEKAVIDEDVVATVLEKGNVEDLDGYFFSFFYFEILFCVDKHIISEIRKRTH